MALGPGALPSRSPGSVSELCSIPEFPSRVSPSAREHWLGAARNLNENASFLNDDSRHGARKRSSFIARLSVGAVIYRVEPSPIRIRYLLWT